MKLSSSAISKLLDLDLDYVILKITNRHGNTEQKQKPIRKKYRNELYELDSLPEFINSDAVSPDLQNKCVLRLLIYQCNTYPIPLMKKIIECNKCVKLIKFTDKYRYYDMFLSDKNQELILKKLASVHLEEIGDDKTYKDFTGGEEEEE